jgi:phage recombination protein Bet
MSKDNNLTVIQTQTGEVKLSTSIIQNYLTRGDGNLSKQEALMFLSLCKYNKLNPFLNEAYLIKFGNQQAQIVVGKDAFIKRANADVRYKGHRAGVIIIRENQIQEVEGTFYLDTDTLVGGWAEVHIKDRIPLKVTVKLSEYIGKKRNGETNSMWTNKPATMIRKVALSHALREALPETLSQMYAEEEMNVDTSNFKQVEPPSTVEAEEDKKAIDPFESKKEIVVDAEIIPEPQPKQAQKKKHEPVGQMQIEIPDEPQTEVEEVAPFLDPNYDEECDF